MLDAAKAPDCGEGPYKVHLDQDDGFYYVWVTDYTAQEDVRLDHRYPIGKTAYRKCRELNASTADLLGDMPAPTPAEEDRMINLGVIVEDTPANPFTRADVAVIMGILKEETPAAAEGTAMHAELEPTEDELDIAAGDFTRFPSQARHEWLEDAGLFAAEMLRTRTDLEVNAKVRVSIGWPQGRKAIGECWHVESSGDGHREIFISPALDDGCKIADVVIHELIHACLPKEAKHGPLFGKPARAVGLEGKLTATYAGEELAELIRAWVAERGPYPAAAMDRHSLVKKQTTRLLKVSCCGPSGVGHEEYVCRMSKGQFERAAPVCGICGEDMVCADA